MAQAICMVAGAQDLRLIGYINWEIFPDNACASTMAMLSSLRLTISAAELSR
jgi:hypothetical protein